MQEWVSMFDCGDMRTIVKLSKKLPTKGRNAKGIWYSNIKLQPYVIDLMPTQYRIEDFK